VELKKALPLVSAHNKRELAKDISAMANTAGGWILYGVEEATSPLGVPAASSLHPLPGGTPLAQQVEDIVYGHVTPRPSMRVREVPVAGGGVFLIVRVDGSTSSLHMLSDDKFYRRGDKGARPMSEPEIRQAYELIARRTTEAHAFVSRVVTQEMESNIEGFLLVLVPHTFREVFDPGRVEVTDDIFRPFQTHTINSSHAANDGFECRMGSFYYHRLRRDGGVAMAFQAHGNGTFHPGAVLVDSLTAIAVARRLWLRTGVTDPFTVAVRARMPRARYTVQPAGGWVSPPALESPLAFDLPPFEGSTIRDTPLVVARQFMDRLFQSMHQKESPFFADDGTIHSSYRDNSINRALAYLAT
jgi:hypothetical protein